MLKWRIYYDAGQTYSNEDGPIEKCPGHGVLSIAYEDRAVGRGVMRGFDFYFYMREEWYGCDLAGRNDYTFNNDPTTGERFPIEVWCQGRGVSDIEFQRALQEALHDPELPPKSGRNQRETTSRI